MLPPLRSGTAVSKHRIGSSHAMSISSTAILRASTARSQSRSFWGGRHRWHDWTSQLDPTYQRYARFRTFKTRAKLLKSIRRRGAFEWDVGAKPFFTPRHLRWASHWRGGRQWYTNDDPNQKATDQAAATEEPRSHEDGYELSKREKQWKEQMEAVRKRIAQDPYEAVFGKRFEPFWSPLVPSWMREEMGLQGWPQSKVEELGKSVKAGTTSSEDVEKVANEPQALFDKDTRHAAKPPSSPGTASLSDFTAQSKNVKDTHEAQVASPESKPPQSIRMQAPLSAMPAEAASGSTGPASSPAKPFSRMTRLERIRHILDNTAKQHAVEQSASDAKPAPKSYAYASSTLWDSVSNKTSRVEWDSTSRRTKKFEYDPISNRMVEVEVPDKVAIDSDSSAIRQSIGNSKKEATRTEPDAASSIPVRQSSDARKSIPIPPPLSQPSHSITLGYTQTSVGPLKSTAMSSSSTKPAALAKLPENDIDMLTADNVRASMGKAKQEQAASKPNTPKQKAQLERDFDANARAQDSEVDAILKERAAFKEQANAASLWDRAEMLDMYEREAESLQKKKAKLIKDEGGLFHIERQKRELQKLDDRIKAVTKRVDAMNLAVESVNPSTLQTSLQRAEARKERPLLQSSIERMQSKSKDLAKAPEQDLDDAAAHESTEPAEAPKNVPKDWTKQADILQADRVQRTAGKRPYPKTRWIDDMNARKVAYEQRKAEVKAAEDAKNAESNARLEKINKMLQAEIAEQKFRMQAFEGRYAQKVKSLRGELDTAFKQSSVHSEKHVDRIRELEAQLSGLKEQESKYANKVKSLRGELERAHKQSAVHAEKHLERIKYLEGELEDTVNKPSATEKQHAQVLPAEGDLCINAPSFSDNGKWYKKPANPPQPSPSEIERATREAQDKALAEQVQKIYEKEYGVIDENHEQPQAEIDTSTAANHPMSKEDDSNANAVESSELSRKQLRRQVMNERQVRAAEEKDRQVVEVESDVDLGEELAKYEKENPEAYNVEQSLTVPENAEKTKSVIADSLEKEFKHPEAKPKETPSATVQWAEPPLYKVLAYDSGNDMMSTATTTTSVLPGSTEEQPLGIPEALSRLYQPARFVPYFAELQSDNFQAIAATREIIVFRQVKNPAEPANEPLRSTRKSKAQIGLEDHGLEVLKAGLEEENHSHSKRRSNVNPIDGMSHRHLEPTTGNFASPTGFVNHDPIFPPEPKEKDAPASEHDAVPTVTSDTYSTIAKESTAKTSRQIWESLPGSNETPVKRTEPVFSGMSKKQRKRMEREQMKQRLREQREREQQEHEENSQDRKWRYEKASRPGGFPSNTGSNAFKYAVGAGLSTATVMYLVGALVERERDPHVHAERAMRERARKREGEKTRLESEAERLAREWERR